MASVTNSKAPRMTLKQALAENAELRATCDKLEARLKDSVERTEYNRVQAVLRTTQNFCAKYKAQRVEPTTQTDRRAAMEAARLEAIATGRSVVVK